MASAHTASADEGTEIPSRDPADTTGDNGHYPDESAEPRDEGGTCETTSGRAVESVSHKDSQSPHRTGQNVPRNAQERDT